MFRTVINRLFNRQLPGVIKQTNPTLPHFSSATSLAAFHAQAAKKSATAYVSPYAVKKPLDYIVIHNRSNNAKHFAELHLKDPWCDLKTIHVVQEDRNPVSGADEVVRVKDWTSMTHFKAQFDKLAAKDPALRKSMAAGRVGFYSVWSAQAENAKWAEAAQAAGFKWIGASPDKMKGLDKIEYKKLCQQLGLPTAEFIEITPPVDVKEKEEAFKRMAEKLVEDYNKSPELAGKAVFAKHNQGGGGRGTKKIAEMNYDNALEAIRKIVNETGGDLNGVYVEQALDLEGAQLFQIEIEGDAGELAPGGRLVWFNKENQKVLEVGFTDKAISEMIPREVYEACRKASQDVFKASGYDSRGTNEILIVKDKHGNWSFKCLELNKRIQVENKALSELVTGADGQPRNVPAEQVMRAMGYPAPGKNDHREKGPAIVAHVRLLSCEITSAGSVYPAGLEIDGALYPQSADVQFVRGSVYYDTDPQVGSGLIKASNWKEMCDKLLQFSREFQFYGPKTEASTYFDFLRKLASYPDFIAGKLGCNQTFRVLANPPVEKGEAQKAVETLAMTVTPLVTHGYRPGEGVKDQPYPTLSQIKEFTDFMDSLAHESAPETPFSRFLKHHNFKTYIAELKDLLANHGGGSVTVIRDVQQSSADQESALIQKATGKIAEIFFAATGMGVGFEEGGAQYQAALMRKFDWMAVLLSGCLSNLPANSLTRSAWLNGLSKKSPQKQAFVFKTIAQEVAAAYGFPLDASPFLPWAPYNFHAGNHPEQDITTRLMLRAKLQAIPNWAEDSRFTQEHFEEWIDRQLDLFEEEDKPLSQIRIKNAGQGEFWTADHIVDRVQTIRQKFKARGKEEPIIFIHNHELNGMGAHVGAEALRRCQWLGYHFLIVDSAPPGTSHNSNIIISRSLTMSPEKREQLERYNQGTQMALNLTTRFNNHNITRGVQNPYSQMAGGTNSSDLADSIKMGISTYDMSKAIDLARDLTGLGTAVTPYSEWIKQIGFAVWKNKDIHPKTPEAAAAYITNGGQLAIATDILKGLQAWITLLPRPAIIEKLLLNHGLSPHPQPGEEKAEAPLDLEAERATLQAKLPRTKVTDRELSTVIAFDKIGQESLEHRDHSALADGARDLTLMMDNPAFVHSQFKKVGDSFSLNGRKITINKIMPNGKGQVDVEFNYQGHIIRTQGIDPAKLQDAAVKQVRLVKDSNQEFGAPMAGKLAGFFVKPGDAVKKGQVLATMEAMKMEHTIKAPRDGVVDSIKTFEADNKNKMVEGNEVLVAFKP